MVEPAVTIAIPTRNRAHYLPTAIDSALAQTCTNTEILILDDASTDGTAEVVACYRDPRIRYIRHDCNIGMAANWNYGYQHGRGRYVAVLHDDDILAPTFLERALAEFERAPDAALVFAPVDIIDEHGACTDSAPAELLEPGRLDPPPTELEQLVRTTWIGWPAILVRRECMLEVGGFCEDFAYHKDWAVWLQLAARWPVRWVPQVLGSFRVHGGQFSEQFRRGATSIAQDRYAMLTATIPTLPLPPEQRADHHRRALRAFAETQLVLAWDLAAAGHRHHARQEARFALRIDRSVILRSPALVAGAFLASWLPPTLIRQLNRARTRLRPLLRRA